MTSVIVGATFNPGCFTGLLSPSNATVAPRRLSEIPEERPDVLDEQFRLLERSKVPAARHLGPTPQVVARLPAELAARRAGATTRPRRRAVAPDPVLAERARMALEQLADRPVRVVADRLEVDFGDETGLAEVAESLERACAALDAEAATMPARAGD